MIGMGALPPELEIKQLKAENARLKEQVLHNIGDWSSLYALARPYIGKDAAADLANGVFSGGDAE